MTIEKVLDSKQLMSKSVSKIYILLISGLNCSKNPRLRKGELYLIICPQCADTSHYRQMVHICREEVHQSLYHCHGMSKILPNLKS